MAEELDNDKTVRVTPGEPVGLPKPSARGNALRAGTRLAEFEITGLIGEGGFGIVYAAHDRSLKRKVALKEYMPSALASRTDELTVSVTAERYREAFDAGLRSFVNEAQTLAQFDHPCLVKVHRYWEANGTAYMVMPYYEGITLKQALKQMTEPPSEGWLIKLLADLLDALETIHRDNTFHRDISPDNILILANGRPLLLDFGAARRVVGDMTQVLTVILKPGYAPVEQYADVPHMKQGAWTDIYALGAVAYFVVTGKAPVPAVGRMMNDTMAPLAKAVAGRYSERLLNAIDKALAVKPEDRPQSVAEFRRILGISADRAQRPPSPRPPSTFTPKAIILVMAGGLMIAALGVWWLYLIKPSTEPARPLPPESRVLPEAKPPETQVPAVQRPFDPVDALDQILRQGEEAHAVQVVADKTKVRIGIDRLSFRLSSAMPGYLYVLQVSTDRANFTMLFPNAIDEDNRIAAKEEIALPRADWRMRAWGPPGVDHFVAIVSDAPRDFTAAGLRKGDPYSEFPLDVAAVVAQSQSDPQAPSPFIGKPVCPASGPCSAKYGAARFTIEEIP